MTEIKKTTTGNWIVKIAPSVVSQAKPRTKPWFLWDTEIKGFGMMVSPAGTKSYVLKYHTGEARTGRTRRLTIGRHGSPWTPHLARKEALSLLNSVLDGHDPAAERHELRRAPTVADLVDKYIGDLGKGSEYHKCAMHLNWFRREIGMVPLAELSGPLVARCRDKLATELCRRKSGTTYTRSPATVNRYLAALSSALTTSARDWGWIEKNPLVGKTLKRAKEPKGRVRFLEDDEREHLLAACQESNNRNLFPLTVLAISTGMRAGEIMGLRWPDIDLERGRITLHETKNNDRRGVPLVGRALDVMKAHAKVRRLDNDLVFASSSGREGFPREAWEKAVREAGIEDFRFHDCRHTAASYMAMNGVPFLTIAKLLGHRTLQMVMRYSHLADDYETEAVAAMNAAIFGEREVGA